MKVLITKNKQYVKIDKYDTWSMDVTLAHIIVPMLKQLREVTHSAPKVSMRDRPDHLIGTEPRPEIWNTDEYHFEAWDWALSEMIFAFESKQNDWEEQFLSGEAEYIDTTLEDGTITWTKSPNHTFKVDNEGRDAYQKRMSNGFRLFGKYYENLWD